eukprot:m.182043 g.182043  ORF g.182043 m.182043 type:complete len:89 (+) comp39284_c0_seq7:613-879(+)
MNQSNATTEEFLLMSEEWKKFASQIDFGQEEMETFKLLKKAGNQLAHLPIDLVKMRQVFAKKDGSDQDALSGEKIFRFLDRLDAAKKL